MINLPVLMTEYRFFVVDRNKESFIVDELEIRGLELPTQDIIDIKENIVIAGRVYNCFNYSTIDNVTRVDYKCEEHNWL